MGDVFVQTHTVAVTSSVIEILPYYTTHIFWISINENRYLVFPDGFKAIPQILQRPPKGDQTFEKEVKRGGGEL